MFPLLLFTPSFLGSHLEQFNMGTALTVEVAQAGCPPPSSLRVWLLFPVGLPPFYVATTLVMYPLPRNRSGLFWNLPFRILLSKRSTRELSISPFNFLLPCCVWNIIFYLRVTDGIPKREGGIAFYNFPGHKGPNSAPPESPRWCIYLIRRSNAMST